MQRLLLLPVLNKNKTETHIADSATSDFYFKDCQQVTIEQIVSAIKRTFVHLQNEKKSIGNVL